MLLPLQALTSYSCVFSVHFLIVTERMCHNGTKWCTLSGERLISGDEVLAVLVCAQASVGDVHSLRYTDALANSSPQCRSISQSVLLEQHAVDACLMFSMWVCYEHFAGNVHV